MSLKTILNKQTDFTGEFPAEYAASGLWRFNESAPDEDTSLVDESGCGRNFTIINWSGTTANLSKSPKGRQFRFNINNPTSEKTHLQVTNDGSIFSNLGERIIVGGQTSETQNAALLAALSTKSARAETTDEIAGCAAAMRAHATRVETGMELFEIVGTGGDHAQSFNISTTAALVAAAAGMKVAKHGNRAASSQCGTADCLEALGVNIHQNPKKCLELLKEAGMCFFFAQEYHTSMKYVGAIRKELGFRTVFNILGPLTNPGTPTMQLLGVYDEYLVEPLAQVLLDLGIRRGMVVYGQDKLDEISMSAATTVCEIRDGWFRTFVLTPEEFGFERCSKEDLKGGTPKENAEITLAILKGEKGPKRNAVLLNAGAALYIGEKADSIKAGIALAEELIDSGKALDTLQKLIEGSNRGEGCV